MNNIYHIPALLPEAIKGLNIKEDGIYVDLTYGSGTFTKAILDSATSVKVIALDKDIDALQNKINDNRLTIFHADFRYFPNYLDYCKIYKVDGIIADLGVSWHQIDNPQKGFSYRYDSPLDMRMNSKSSITAEYIINNYSLEQIHYILQNYGNVFNSFAIAKAIVKKRETKPILTTWQLKEAIIKLIPHKRLNKELSKIFQAIRIEVNDEIGALKEMLLKVPERLKEGGRIVILTYHSLEDKIVKSFFKYGNFDGENICDLKGNKLKTPLIAITQKPIVPDKTEIEKNKRIRSAKLRIAEKYE
ncbi:MAG: 16S rRNA (cytosine(1402)-N(4))-methyltransferase RsmH [Bacteroidales bacterium]|nr:16S rRNA (cytosine(1402)-N(4))-methyltransferase RsmH [Bacteroidales bacterium]